MDKQIKSILNKLEMRGSSDAIAGMARYGIVAKKVFGVSAPDLRAIAKETGHNHMLALKLWATEIYDARILAAFIDDPRLTTETQMERWVKDFDNWAICDGCCIHLFRKTPFAWKKAIGWSKSDKEFVKRAAFALFATLAVHDKQSGDNKFIQLLPIIKGASTDERNGVKKAVNWALRQIGKRNIILNNAAIKTAKEIREIDSPAARWIAGDALRELTSENVKDRIKK